MATQKTERISFASAKNIPDYPDFLDIQIKSFQDFFQLETKSDERANEGLYNTFMENFPITDTRNQFVLEFLELEEQARVFITREQPEQQPVGQLERPAGSGIAELEQAPVLGDGADVLDAVTDRGLESEQVRSPDARVLLLSGNGSDLPGGQDGGLEEVEPRLAGGGQVAERPEADALTSVLDQPGKRNPMWCRKIHAALEVDGPEKRGQDTTEAWI